MRCGSALRGASRAVRYLGIRNSGFTGRALIILMVIAAFGLFQISIFIRLRPCCSAVAAGNGLTLYQESVCVSLVFHILAVRIGLHLKLFADLFAVFVILVYGLVPFLILGFF